MTRDELYQIGYIKKPHGLHGEVTVVLLPESPHPGEVANAFIEFKGTFVPYRLARFSARPDQLFVKWEDVSTVEEAAKLKGCGIYLPKSTRPKPGRGGFYDDEIIGFAVHMGGKEIARVKEIAGTGSNRFVVLDNARETFIPVNSPFIKSINRSRRILTVELPEGTLDL